ncbi:MAG: glycoside hydrolase family 3 C-terminal domain-containing protein [Clostridia bacterium]|nr:glycoside hydrolase family 3 C-terminal domain-containing protein [Clostridia bacterium]
MNCKKARETARRIVSQMTVEEKITQLVNNSPAIERLGINEYNWWNEALHGVARTGTATLFPQAIGLAATFDPELVNSVAGAISDEGRAKYNKYVEFGARTIYKGLTYWSPNINIFRDPRWGRGHETYGEDPYLTAEMGVNFIKGIQGDGEYLKAAACAKHFAVHSGPEMLRHTFDVKISDKDLYETYLPAFERTVKAGVAGVMGAYNRYDGEPCCANRKLMNKILRGDWKFDGYFVSDCGAINDIWKNHKFVETPEEAAAAALSAGCDLNCGNCYKHLVEAYEKDLVSEEDITRAAENLYTIRALLGEFEEKRPYSDIPYSVVDCREHNELNLEAARQSVVLLKNENNFLPLDKNTNCNIGVIGPNALSIIGLEGNYQARASKYITVADGIRSEFANAQIRVSAGSGYLSANADDYSEQSNLIADGLAVASVSDTVFLCLGLNGNCEGEEDDAGKGDKPDIKLPEPQRKMAEAVCDICENVVVILLCGSSVDIGEKIRNHAKAIVCGWYPGSLGGLAVAQIIAGEYAPCGRLPITFYKGDEKLPEMADYSMKGRTYRFFEGEPLYPFGFGLGYSDVEYTGASRISENENSVKVHVSLKNNGMACKEKIQIYAICTDSRTETPLKQLCCVKAASLDKNGTAEIDCEIDRYWLSAVLPDGSRVAPDEGYKLFYAKPCADAVKLIEIK